MKTANRIREMLNNIEEIGFSSQYFSVENDLGETVKIRVSDHSANAGNNSGETLSFVTLKNCAHTGFGKRNMLCNEFVLVDGDPVENWSTLEELLEYHDISE